MVHSRVIVISDHTAETFNFSNRIDAMRSFAEFQQETIKRLGNTGAPLYKHEDSWNSTYRTLDPDTGQEYYVNIILVSGTYFDDLTWRYKDVTVKNVQGGHTDIKGWELQ